MAATVHEAVTAADAVGEETGLDGVGDVLEFTLAVLVALLLLVGELLDGVKDEGVEDGAVIGYLPGHPGLRDDGVLLIGADVVVLRSDEPCSFPVDDPAPPRGVGHHAVPVIEDELVEAVAVVGIPEVNDHIALAIDEADVAVLLDGGETLGEDPGAAVLRGDGYLSRVHIIVSALALRAEDGEGVVAGGGGPVQLDVLDGDLPGRGVLDGDLAVIGADGDELVIEEETVIGDLLYYGSTGRLAAGQEGCGGESREKEITCFHKACFELVF